MKQKNDARATISYSQDIWSLYERRNPLPVFPIHPTNGACLACLGVYSEDRITVPRTPNPVLEQDQGQAQLSDFSLYLFRQIHSIYIPEFTSFIAKSIGTCLWWVVITKVCCRFSQCSDTDRRPSRPPPTADRLPPNASSPRGRQKRWVSGHRHSPDPAHVRFINDLLTTDGANNAWQS